MTTTVPLHHTLADAVATAVNSIDDPEYPEISITDLGLVEHITIDDDHNVDIGLIPTFTGCPALAMIADDVTAAVGQVAGVGSVTVRWLTSPPWSVDRVTAAGRDALATRFTVAVEIAGHAPRCPRCDTETVAESMFGPSRCRSVRRCPSCRETVEVLRG